MFPEAPSATKLSLENTWDLNHGSLFPGKVSEQLYKQRMDSLTEFLRTKRFPYDVRKRVRGFYVHLYANKVTGAAFSRGAAVFACASLPGPVQLLMQRLAQGYYPASAATVELC